MFMCLFRPLFKGFWGLSGIFPEFPPESPSCTGGVLYHQRVSSFPDRGVNLPFGGSGCFWGTLGELVGNLWSPPELEAAQPPFVQMALQTQKNYFRINYAFRSRYRYRQILFWNFFFVADADTAVLCSFEGAA